MTTVTVTNARDLKQELDWFERVVTARFALYFKRECDYHHISELQPPELTHSKSTYANFIHRHQLGFDERTAVALALAPHLQPSLLDSFELKNKARLAIGSNLRCCFIIKFF